ncbi:transposase [Mesorhizobium sp. M1409]|uniref:transposase DNA-binding-containing protein n=1 Tax=unclassified Mesorhizobium TaxID=325217 RepID=UPI003334BD99
MPLWIETRPAARKPLGRKGFARRPFPTSAWSAGCSGCWISAAPSKPIPAVCGDWAAAKAAYRFFGNRV